MHRRLVFLSHTFPSIYWWGTILSQVISEIFLSDHIKANYSIIILLIKMLRIYLIRHNLNRDRVGIVTFFTSSLSTTEFQDTHLRHINILVYFSLRTNVICDSSYNTSLIFYVVFNRSIYALFVPFHTFFLIKDDVRVHDLSNVEANYG